MRISTQMITDTFVANLQDQQARLYVLQQQSATGKRILNPSDDPIGAQQVAATLDRLSANHQYQTNVSDARSFVEQSASVAQSAGSALDSALVAAQTGANDTESAADRTALGSQVNQLLEEALDTANDRSVGRYTLAGTHTATAPYVASRDAQGQITAVALDPTVTPDAVDRQVDVGNVIKVNLNGPDIFGGGGAPAGSTDYFATLIQLRDALNNNDGATVRSLIPQLQALHDQVQAQVAVAGSMAQRLDSVQQKLQQEEIDLQSNRSRLEDVDVAQVSVDLQTQENLYQQALTVGNRILSLDLNRLLG
ncbi:MAG TPA: flagellar hook-associated protein FlgL [Candidatus Saccharimonadales bacterium]|nr:flagellar hook-associated protein FlgL [Candidatus Saccharimonadales bacterium]